METFFGWIVIGLIPAVIAKTKNRNFLAWWAYGCLLSIIAIAHAIIIEPLEKQQEPKD
ncbi:MAG: hypothetical protein LiPW30_759 [Parcubacteria group bacterium LiPW_30]|nr:MAG: hypothetical protein LiPW30_759 [Parcubacteria group bacterium LiPW_30]